MKTIAREKKFLKNLPELITPPTPYRVPPPQTGFCPGRDVSVSVVDSIVSDSVDATWVAGYEDCCGPALILCVCGGRVCVAKKTGFVDINFVDIN